MDARLDAAAWPDARTRAAFVAWLTGGLYATDALLGSAESFRALRDDSDDQLLRMLRTATLAMVARWAHKLWASTTDELGLNAALTNAASDVCDYYGGVSHGDIEECLLLYEQLRRDRELHELAPSSAKPLAFAEPELVAGLIARALGRRLPTPIQALEIPVDDVFDLVAAGWRFTFEDDLAGNIAARLVLMDAELVMFASGSR